MHSHKDHHTMSVRRPLLAGLPQFVVDSVHMVNMVKAMNYYNNYKFKKGSTALLVFTVNTHRAQGV